ncbi:MAG TPA: DoxX family membrane protein [Armatimonadetes bacterium]|nr:DoxX family membrane protein [Armatimonadota bacterium]
MQSISSRLKAIRHEQLWGVACLLLRLGLGTVFIIASMDKILDPRTFVSVVLNYRILPPALVPFFAIVLPWLEFFTGMLLILGYAVESAAIVVSTLLVAFLIGIIVNLARGVQMACGCFGILEGGSIIGWHTVIRDLALLAMGIVLVFAHRPFMALENLFAYWRGVESKNDAERDR